MKYLKENKNIIIFLSALSNWGRQNPLQDINYKVILTQLYVYLAINFIFLFILKFYKFFILIGYFFNIIIILII